MVHNVTGKFSVRKLRKRLADLFQTFSKLHRGRVATLGAGGQRTRARHVRAVEPKKHGVVGDFVALSVVQRGETDSSGSS